MIITIIWVLIMLFSISINTYGIEPPPEPNPEVKVDPRVIDFSNVNVGSSLQRSVLVRNDGSADLIIGTITNPSSPFSIVKDECSNQTIEVNKNCTIVVGFVSAVIGTFESNFTIPYNNPDKNSVIIRLFGSAKTSGNNPPTKPILTYPPNNSTGMPTALTLKWNKCSDPDGHQVSYRLYIGTDPNFTGINPIILASISNSLSYAVVSGYQIGIIALFGIVVISGLSRRRKKVGFLIVAVIFIGGLLLGSCGGGGGGPTPIPTPPSDEITQNISGLNSGTKYYWKIVADDGNGGVVESNIYSFTTG